MNNTTKPKAKQIKKIEVEVVASSRKDVPDYHVSVFFGGLSETEGLISVFRDDLISEINQQGRLELAKVEKKHLMNMRFSPQTWKRLALWMMNKVEFHEKKFGEIKVSHLIQRKNEDSNISYEFI